MSSIRIERVGFACGARITGIDVSKKLSQEELDLIHKAWLEHLVLVFPGQQLDAKALVRFTSLFGPLDDYATQPFNRHPEINEVMVLTNKHTNGKPSKTYNAGQNWHTDLSYTLRPAKATMWCSEFEIAASELGPICCRTCSTCLPKRIDRCTEPKGDWASG